MPRLFFRGKWLGPLGLGSGTSPGRSVESIAFHTQLFTEVGEPAQVKTDFRVLACFVSFRTWLGFSLCENRKLEVCPEWGQSVNHHARAFLARTYRSSTSRLFYYKFHLNSLNPCDGKLRFSARAYWLSCNACHPCASWLRKSTPSTSSTSRASVASC